MFRAVLISFILTISTFGRANLQSYIAEANSGNAQSQHDLGRIYETGDGVKTNQMLAFELYFKSAEQGNADAQYQLANCFHKGIGSVTNYTDTIKWATTASKQNNPKAQNLLGYCYRHGQGVETNFADAVKWFQKAADQGYSEAQYNLGLRYEFGQGVETNSAKAFELYVASAEQNYANAQYKVARCYSDGIGGPKNNVLAVKWLQKSADQGYASAWNSLGYHYEKGYGIGKNLTKAAHCYQLAAKQGNPAAQANLAYCYYKGRGVEKDPEESTHWYKKSADQRFVRGEYCYGLHLLYGRGIEQNAEEAVKWILKAAEQNYASAVKSMVYRYEKGEGVEQNLDEAERWYEKALALGYTRDLKKQKELKDHAAIFAEMDEKLHSAPESGETCVNWMKTAIKAKGDLNLEAEIDPWLEELATTFSNDWKILRAVAMGYIEATNKYGYRFKYNVNGIFYNGDKREHNRWRALKLMERAYALATTNKTTTEEMAALTRDYLVIVIEDRMDEPKLLQVKTSDLTFEQLIDNDFRNKLSDDLTFFVRPASPAAATSDGELVLALLGNYDFTSEELPLPREVQLPLAVAGYIEFINERPRFTNNAIWKIFHNLKDDQFVIWDKLTPIVKQLPADYTFIPTLESLAAKYPETVSEFLARLLQGRSQLDRAAHYYEVAGNTNSVRNIRANQGTFARCPPQAAGTPARVDYHYRNGEELEIELYRINAGTNLLERLEAGTVMQTELNLLKGVPNWIGNTGDFEKPGALESIETRTIALSPLSDHRDSSIEINFQPLEAGAYLARAQMKDGNKTETILNIRDTLLYAASTPSEVNTNAHTLFILCDAQTGKPRPDETIQILELSGGSRRDENRKTIDGPYTVDLRIEGKTDANGCYILEERLLSYPDAKLYLLANLNAFPLVVESGRHDRSYSSFSSGSNQEPFVATDRPIYQPGDTGHFFTWQGADTKALPIRIREPNSKFELPIIGKPEIIPNQFGGTSASFEVPQEARLGEYAVEWNLGKYGERLTDLRVEQYRAPEFEVTVKQLDDGRIEISATYAYGAPVALGKLAGLISFRKASPAAWHPTAPFDGLWGKGYWWLGGQFSASKQERYEYNPEITLTELDQMLDSNGKAIIDLKMLKNGASSADNSGWITVSATVTDAAEKEYSASERFANNLKKENLCCWTEKAFFTANESISVHATAEKEIALTLNLAKISGTNTTALTKQPITNGSCKLGKLDSGLYEIDVCDPADTQSKPFRFFVLGGAPTELTAENPIRVTIEKSLYKNNEAASVLVQVDQPGRYIYFFDRLNGRDAYSIPLAIKMVKTSLRIPLPINGEAGTFQCAAMTVVNGTFHMDAARIHTTEESKKAGVVTIEPHKSHYAPGETVQLEIRALNAKGEGEHCAVAVSVYNRMLDSFSSSSAPLSIYRSLFSTWLNESYHNLSLKDGLPYPALSKNPDWVMSRIGGPFSPQVIKKSAGTEDLFGDSSGSSAGFSLPDFSEYGMGKPMSGIGAMACEDITGATDAPVYLRKNLSDHAYWNAFVETDENGNVALEFPVPDSMTEWKVSAWAIHTNFAASGEATFKCAKELVVQLNTPRFMIEGDQLEISASVRNHGTNTLTVIARSSISMLSSVIKAMEPAAEKMLYWTYTARDFGTETIKVAANSQGVGDAIAKPLPLLTRSMLKRGGDSGILTPENPVAQIEINIPENVEPASLKLELNTTPNMLETVAAALPFLTEYPYGCTEQTLNRFLPSVTVLQTLVKLDLKLKDLGLTMPADRQTVYDRAEILKRAQSGIDQLLEAKAWNGSWSWNMEANREHKDPLVTALTARGLAMAAKHEELSFDKGQLTRCVDGMVDRLTALSNPPWRRKSRAPLNPSDMLTAVVLQELGPKNYLVLERDQKAANELMLKIGPFFMKHTGELSLYGKVLLAYFFELRNETELRDELIAHIGQYLNSDSTLGTYWLRSGKNEWWRWQNDKIEMMAWYLKLLNRTEPNSAKTAGVARWLLINRQHGDHWKSTRDTAICVEALCEYITAHPATADRAEVIATLNGDSLDSGLKTGQNLLELKADGTATVFHDAHWSFHTLENPITPERCDLVGISRIYYRLNGGTGKREKIEEEDMLKAGETIEVELTIDSPQELEYLLATDFKPAGFECIETQSGYRSNGLFHYQEIRNERIACYINHLPKGLSTLSYRLRPEHAGLVSALPATIELMYAPKQAANSAEAKLRIER